VGCAAAVALAGARHLSYWYLAAALLGLADAGFQSQAYTVRRNINSTGLAQIVGQVQTCGRDSHSKHWAKSRNLGEPCETRVRGARA
jgi:hypothetical protein